MHFRSLVLSVLLVPCLAPAAESVLVEDSLDTKPAPPWIWLRENPTDWRTQNGALEISVRPGNAQTVGNALVRPAPERSRGRFAVEVTVTNLKAPTEQYEQAGITWYCGGEPVFKFVKERVDGQLMIIPSRKPVTHQTVRLRVEVTANRWRALFRPGNEGEFQLAATGELPAPNADQISIQCYHGPADERHWIRFDDFRILKLED